MKVPNKSLENGFSMPVYGLGTWMIGEREDSYSSDMDAIQRAIENGVGHIDTAELYGQGVTERLVGQVIAKHQRSALLIASKALSDRARPEEVISACHESLDRLNTDYLDLYMPHVRNTDVPLGETLSAFDQLVDNGLVRHIGVSNFGTESLAEALKLSRHPIVANQVHYSLFMQAPETSGLLAYCQANDVFLVAYRPIVKSRLERTTFVGTSPSDALKKIANKYNKTRTQVALNWLITQQNVNVICKTGAREHLEENLGALDWSLTQEDVALLHDEYESRSNAPDNPLN